MNSKGFAYLDQYGILHMSSSKKVAQRFGSGKVVEVEIPCEGGYPLVNVAEEGSEPRWETIIVYSLDEAYVDGNRGDGDKIPLDLYPEIKELYSRLM